MLADVVKQYVITLQRTGISGAARPVQMRKPTSSELCVGRQPVEHFQPISEHPSVIIRGNSRLFVEAPRTADTGSRSQKPQYVPLRDATTTPSPMSVPRMSGNTSEANGRKKKQDTQTFENDRRSRTPKVAKRPRDLVGHNTNHFRFISENIEFVCMPKIFGRFYFETVPISLRRFREFFVKMRVVPESQAFIFVLDTAEVP